MIKHKWAGTSGAYGGGYFCNKDLGSRGGQPEMLCDGCGAKIGRNDGINAELRTAGSGMLALAQELDYQWHHNLRPMAEFAGLVEEAQCQQ